MKTKIAPSTGRTTSMTRRKVTGISFHGPACRRQIVGQPVLVSPAHHFPEVLVLQDQFDGLADGPAAAGPPRHVMGDALDLVDRPGGGHGESYVRHDRQVHQVVADVADAVGGAAEPLQDLLEHRQFVGGVFVDMLVMPISAARRRMVFEPRPERMAASCPARSQYRMPCPSCTSNRLVSPPRES